MATIKTIVTIKIIATITAIVFILLNRVFGFAQDAHTRQTKKNKIYSFRINTHNKKAPNIQINLMLGVSLLCTLRYAQSLVSSFVCSRLTAFFSNTSSFTCKVTEVIQFSTTYFTNFVNLDFVDKWRVHREDTFNTYVV